jgi:DNA-directed RNA polymerase specialized sigma24 family protein
VELVVKVAQICWKSFANARISRANKSVAPFVGHADPAPIGKHLEAKKNQDQLDSLSERDETLGFAVQSGLKRTRSWRVPPNWSRDDWLEELAAVATAAAWQALCDFDPDRGVPLAGFGYCRMMTCCLSRYRREWRYALHLVASDSCEKETTTFKHPELTASSAAKVNGTHSSNVDLRGAVGALPAEQRHLIEQLFWEERTEVEVANTMSINQSTLNRRKQTILKSLRTKLGDRNELQKFCIELLVASNLTSWLADLADVALGA